MKILAVPKITNKQKEILNLLYTYRFLTRIQIQTILKHKDKKTINLWLKDLRAKDYINWIYNKDHFAEKTKPAIYYLGRNGRRHIQNTDMYDREEIRKRYREDERTQTFINRSLLIADCCIALRAAVDASKNSKSWYYYETEAIYRFSQSFYNFINNTEMIRPNLCFSKEQDSGHGEAYTTDSYILEIFDATLPRYRLRHRLNSYVGFLDEEGGWWQENTATEQLPIILLVCASTTDLIYAKRLTRGLLREIWDFGDDTRPRIRFTTIEKLRQHQVTAKEIWEQV